MNRTTQPPTIGRHKRRCTVCKHPDRQLIEQEFLRWRSAEELAHEFKIPDCTAIYRHAHALGLFERRRLDIRGVSEQIMEFAELAKPNANAVLEAIRVSAHITPDGQWIESPKRVIVTHEFVHRDVSGDALTPSAAEGAAPKNASKKAGFPHSMRPDVLCREASEVGIPSAVSIPLRVDGLSLNISPGSRPQERRKSNGTARTQKKLALQVTSAQQVLNADRAQIRKFTKRLKIQGLGSLIANHQVAVPESQLAENAVHKNS